MTNLRVSIVSSVTDAEYDNKLKNVFNNLISYVKSKHSDFCFEGIETFRLSYESEPYILSRNFIASLTPSKYLNCKEVLKSKIQPILAVKKKDQQLPYFSAFFIANIDSEINSIHSDKIKRIFLVSVNSTSGFIAPLNKLWESGVISTPSERGIREKGWEMILVGNQSDIEKEIIMDKEAIGATGEFKHQDEIGKSYVKPILRYYNLPQDVIVISNDLIPFQEIIIEWFTNLFKKDSLNKYLKQEANILSGFSTSMTGVHEIDSEFENSLNDLEIMMRHAKTIPEDNRNSLKTHKIFLASSEELRSDRDAFEIFMSRENNEFVKKGFYFELIRWENFIDAMSKVSLQNEYNKAISECDILVCLFFTKVGKYTKEEFEVAFGHFTEMKKPLIYTYFKNDFVLIENITNDINFLLEFRDRIQSLGHYRTIYKNIDDLKYQFKMQLQKFTN